MFILSKFQYIKITKEDKYKIVMNPLYFLIIIRIISKMKNVKELRIKVKKSYLGNKLNFIINFFLF